MKFPIIQVSVKPVTKDERITLEQLNNDVSVNVAADYLSHMAEPLERKTFIKEQLPKILDGIAIVDSEQETIKIRPDAEIRYAIRADLTNKLKSWNEKFKKGTLSYDEPSFEGHRYRNTNAMFILNKSHACFSGPFIENLMFYAGKTLYIGGIAFAHR